MLLVVASTAPRPKVNIAPPYAPSVPERPKRYPPFSVTGALATLPHADKLTPPLLELLDDPPEELLELLTPPPEDPDELEELLEELLELELDELLELPPEPFPESDELPPPPQAAKATLANSAHKSVVCFFLAVIETP